MAVSKTSCREPGCPEPSCRDDPTERPIRLAGRTDIASGGRAQYFLPHACKLTLDPNTAHKILSLSEENRVVRYVGKAQPYAEHAERFECFPQVLCREGLTGRCYWEAEWSGGADISMVYKSIERKGKMHEDVAVGWNSKSWSLRCNSNDGYLLRHNKQHTHIPFPPSSSGKVRVYLDWEAGTLSFYIVSSDKLTHMLTFHSTFTEPLYPGFWLENGASVSLCQTT